MRSKRIGTLAALAATVGSLALVPAASEAGHARNCGRLSNVVGSRDVQVYANGRTTCSFAKRWTPRWMRSRREPSGYSCRNISQSGVKVVFVCRASSQRTFYGERR